MDGNLNYPYQAAHVWIYKLLCIFVVRLWQKALLQRCSSVQSNFRVNILHKSIAGRYRPVRVADGPITVRCRFINNASWVNETPTLVGHCVSLSRERCKWKEELAVRQISEGKRKN